MSIVENPKPHGKSYDQWLGDQSKPSHRELLRAAIDNALAQKPADLEELLKLLRESGCEASKRGQSYRLKLPGWSKVARLDSLGDGYTLEDLLAVLAGQKEHTPRRKPVKQADPPKVNLLVDIQAKLQAGKGAGYVRWAKVFNVKQMAQTVNYLTEHNLLEYAVLEEKAAAATAHHNELSAKIKAAEIAVLRTHIINYAKTRETYVPTERQGLLWLLRSCTLPHRPKKTVLYVPPFYCRCEQPLPRYTGRCCRSGRSSPPHFEKAAGNPAARP